MGIFLVLLSGMVHSVWNLLTKKSISKTVFLACVNGLSFFMFLPLAWSEISDVRVVSMNAIWVFCGSLVFHGLYVLLVAKSYTLGDLSKVYPLMRGSGPLLVPIIGMLLLHEQLSLFSWFGVIIIVWGIFILSDIRAKQTSSSKLSTWVALMVGAAAAGYTLFDRCLLAYAPAYIVNQVGIAGNFIGLSWALFRVSDMRVEWRSNYKNILLGSILAPGGYILFLVSLHYISVSQAAPMREIGTVFGTFLGIFLLKETRGKQRIGASILITCGVLLLGLF